MIGFESSGQLRQASSTATAAATARMLLWMLCACCRQCFALSSGEIGFHHASFSHRQEGRRLRGSAAHQTSSAMMVNDSKVYEVLSVNSRETIVDGDGHGGAVPEQIHLALADSRPRGTYALSVSWLTWTDVKTQVFWGRETDALLESATGNSTRYTTHHVNLDLEEVTSGFLHSAVIDGLEPSSSFYYACGDEEVALSTVRQIRTPGAVGGNESVTFGVLGDLGQTNHSRSTMDRIREEQQTIDVVLHAGDLSYADCHQELWDTFLRMLDPVASRVPWMVAAGNHEIEAGTITGGPFAAYEHRFRMPSAGPPSRGLHCGTAGGLDGNETACGPGLNDLLAFEAATLAAAAGLDGEGVAEAALQAREAIVPFRGAAVTTGWPKKEGGSEDGGGEEGDSQPKCAPSEWSGTYDYGNSFYSFDVASVHVVVMNPYTATGEGSLQHKWLIEDLEECDRSLTPWVVAMFHCPWYNSNLKHQSERMAVTAMQAMEPVLSQHKAAFVISGHVHAYERSVPAVGGEPAEDGPVHVVVGGAGNRENHDREYYRLPGWSAFRNGSVYGLGILSVINSTMALWEWKSNELEAVVHDSTWISNPFGRD